MVACFRYASINVHSVYLPPPKLDFNYRHQEWVEKEANEVSQIFKHPFLHRCLSSLLDLLFIFDSILQVANSTELLFNEVLTVLAKLKEKRPSTGSLDGNVKVLESRKNIVELEEMLQVEKAEFEVYFLSYVFW